MAGCSGQIACEKSVRSDLGVLICVTSSYNKRQFVTTTSNMFAPRTNQITTNPGIISEITKRQKHAMEQ